MERQKIPQILPCWLGMERRIPPLESTKELALQWAILGSGADM